MATIPPASRWRCSRPFAACTRTRCGFAATASIAWPAERSCGRRCWRGGRPPPSGARGSARSSGSGASGPSTCSTRSFGAARPSAPSGAPLPSPRYECDSPGDPGRVRTSARSPRAPPRPAPGPSQRDHDARHPGRPGLRHGVRDGLGAVGWLLAALQRGVRSAGRPRGARGRAGDGVRGVLRLDARPGGRSGAVYGDRPILPARWRGSKPDGPGGRALLRGAQRLAAGVVRPVVGLGAVSTTFIAGVENVRRGGGLPIGSLTQMGTIRLGKRTDRRSPKIKDFLPLAGVADLVFAAWDPIPDDAYTAARKAGVLEPHHLEPIAAFLKEIKPLPAAFDQNYVKRLHGTNVKPGKTKRELAEQLRADIRQFKQTAGVERAVMIWAASTEVFLTPGPAHQSVAALEQAMERNDPAIAPFMAYAYAALMENVPFANGAPNLTVDIPALERLADERKLPIGGKDFKTGQTMMKTVLAPAFKARMLGLAGWYSTNILGNRDGEVLDDPESFKTKEESKLGVLEYILQPDQYPELYGNVFHKVRINYYPPRGDNKEGWDNI